MTTYPRIPTTNVHRDATYCLELLDKMLCRGNFVTFFSEKIGEEATNSLRFKIIRHILSHKEQYKTPNGVTSPNLSILNAKEYDDYLTFISNALVHYFNPNLAKSSHKFVEMFKSSVWTNIQDSHKCTGVKFLSETALEQLYEIFSMDCIDPSVFDMPKYTNCAYELVSKIPTSTYPGMFYEYMELYLLLCGGIYDTDNKHLKEIGKDIYRIGIHKGKSNSHLRIIDDHFGYRRLYENGINSIMNNANVHSKHFWSNSIKEISYLCGCIFSMFFIRSDEPELQLIGGNIINQLSINK